MASELHRTGKRKIRSDCKDAPKCPNCEYISKNKIAMKNHILNIHSNLETRKKEFKYYCKQCDFGTFSKSIIDTHNQSDKHNRRVKRI